MCSNPNGVTGEGFYPQLTVCWVTASREAATRRFHKRHEKAKPDSAGYLPTDGAVVWVSPDDLTPDDDFLGDSLAQQRPRHQHQPRDAAHQ